MKFCWVKAVCFVLVAVASSGCSKEQRVWIPGWQETSALSTARAGAAVVTHNGVIYMLGGIDGHDFLGSTEFARVQSDGTLTAWQPGPPLLEARGFVEAAVHDNWIYIAGGGNGPNGHNLLRSVERARIQADGSLGPWIAEANSMLVPRRCSKIIATKKGLYSFGGFGGALLDTVEHANFLKDGTLGPWQLEPATLTMARRIAMKNGVRYAYTGNVSDMEGGSTYCHKCGQILIGRDWYELSEWNLTVEGNCHFCGTPCAGVFEAKPGRWGARRRPVLLKQFT